MSAHCFIRFCQLLSFLIVLHVTMNTVIAKNTDNSGEPFRYIASYRDVKSDPDKIWVGDDVAPNNDGTVSIFEYGLKRNNYEYIVSQIWNDNCSIKVCPTRLVKIDANGSKTVLIDDMMHQIIPVDDSRFSSFQSNPETKQYANSPFILSSNGKSLINFDYKFPIGD